jgi:hypothetical protein
LRTVFGFLARYLWSIKFTLMFSGILTVAVFLTAKQIPLSFLVGLVTINSLLIAVVGFIATVVMRIVGPEKMLEISRSIANTAKREEVRQVLTTLGQVFYLTVPIMIALIAILPYFIAAILSLIAMLMPEQIAIPITAFAFWLTLSSFLGMVSAFWNYGSLMWKTQEPNIKKIIAWLIEWTERRKSGTI